MSYFLSNLDFSSSVPSSVLNRHGAFDGWLIYFYVKVEILSLSISAGCRSDFCSGDSGDLVKDWRTL